MMISASAPSRRPFSGHRHLSLFPSHRKPLRCGTRRTRLVGCVLTLAAAATGYVVIAAAIQAAREPFVGFADVWVSRAVDATIAAWFFFIGSSVGSFLNVVAWRVPRGGSINGHSHCPWCATRIAWHDNWPVFGWIVLGGRCRTCGLAISPRYPIVEAAVGLSIAAIGMTLFYLGGTNLPFWPQRFGRITALWSPFFTAEVLIILCYHMVTIAGLWSLALVRRDGIPLPRPLTLWALTFAALPMIIHPALAVVPWTVTESPTWRAEGDYLNALMRLLTSVAVGVLVARIVGRKLFPAADPKFDPRGGATTRLLDLMVLVVVIAIVVGWHAVVPVVAVALIVAMCLPHWVASPNDPLARLAIAFPPVLTFQLVFWAWLHDAALWPSVNTTPWVTLTWAATLFILPMFLIDRARHTRISEAPPDTADQTNDPQVPQAS